MSWPDAHREAIVAAATAREQLNLAGFGRIDIFEALLAADLKVMFRPLNGVAAFYEPARPGASAGVLVNSRHPLALQRYSAAHEYGHHVFDHGPQVDRDGEPRLPRGNLTREERLAEAFAAWFLMPPEAARAALTRLGLERPTTAQDAYALALRLGVSYKAICVHLPSLKLVSTATARAWSEQPLKSLKQELSDDPPPGDWHNDVWSLTAGDAGAPLVVRTGDRILIPPLAQPAEAAIDGLHFSELPARDLLHLPRVCVDVSTDALPGPRQLQLHGADDTSVLAVLQIERPLRGRYVPRDPSTA